MKKMDMKTGHWYYVHRASGEETWEVPRGNIPMAPPRNGVMMDLAKMKQAARVLKAEESKKRQYLIEQRLEEYKQSHTKETSAAEEAEIVRRDTLWKDAVEHGSKTGEVNVSWQKLGNVSDRIFNFRR